MVTKYSASPFLPKNIMQPPFLKWRTDQSYGEKTVTACYLPRRWLLMGFGKDSKISGFAKRGKWGWVGFLIILLLVCAPERRRRWWWRREKGQLCPWDFKQTMLLNLDFIREIGLEKDFERKIKKSKVLSYPQPPLLSLVLKWVINNWKFSLIFQVRF